MSELDSELATLAAACVQTESENDFELDDDPWQRLSEMVDEDPQGALVVARRIAALTEDMHILSVLGAGAIEEMLEKQPAMLDAILIEARRLPSFRNAFRCVWTGGMAQPVKTKVDEALRAYGGNL